MLLKRPRRNRKNAAIRALSQETYLHPSDLIMPCFLLEGDGKREPIASMPGVERYSVDQLLIEAKKVYLRGVRSFVLFPVVPEEKKNSRGSEAIKNNNLLVSAVRALKKELGDACIITDIALDPYTDHGHDGIVGIDGSILNDATLDVLGEMALAHAEAGADMVAPSDMMDGRVFHLRQMLDRWGHEMVGIMSYTAKYASALYSPFRDALVSTPKFGDKKTYQMNPGNVREALLEGALDEQEGADMLLVKPALPYLDVLAKLKEQTKLPVGAYHVSGEYAMIMAAAEKGWLDAPQSLYEVTLSIKRAGADYILTYGIPQILPLLRQEIKNLDFSFSLS